MPIARRLTVIFSSMMCGVLLVGFLRGIFIGDLLRWRTARGTYFEIVTVPTQFRISAAKNWPIAQPFSWIHGAYPELSAAGAVGHHLMGIRTGLSSDSQSWRVNNNGTVGQVIVMTHAFPYPILIVLTAIPLLLSWISRRVLERRAAQRRERGLCVACGYDLRAAGERCSECGSAIQNAG